jgi:hypothetical protein
MTILYAINTRIELQKLEKIERVPVAGALVAGELDLLDVEKIGASMAIGSIFMYILVVVKVIIIAKVWFRDYKVLRNLKRKMTSLAVSPHNESIWSNICIYNATNAMCNRDR